MKESAYQAELIKRLRVLLPGCVILKNDANYMQGVPDLSIFWERHWAMLEVKMSAEEPFQPNQVYYLQELNKMSFASVIYPEIEQEVLDALQQAFAARWKTRRTQRK